MHSQTSVTNRCKTTQGPERAILRRNGEAGIWFNLETARCILVDLERYHTSTMPELVLQLDLTRDGLDQSLVFIKRQEKIIHNLVTAQEEALAARDLYRDRSQRYGRQRWIWTGVGLVVGLVAGLLLGVSLGGGF